MNPLARALPRAQARRIFEQDILPAIGANGPPVAEPTFMIVGGQPGSGKSTTIRQAVEQLGKQQTQKIIPDDMMCYVPRYEEQARINAREAQLEINPDFLNWASKLQKRAFDRRVNILLESPRPSNNVYLAENAKEKGYKTELRHRHPATAELRRCP